MNARQEAANHLLTVRPDSSSAGIETLGSRAESLGSTRKGCVAIIVFGQDAKLALTNVSERPSITIYEPLQHSSITGTSHHQTSDPDSLVL